MKVIKVFALGLVLVLVGASCHKEEKVNQPPRILRVRFNPSPPLPGKDLRVLVETRDPEEDRIRAKFRWYLDGKLVQKGKSPVLSGNLISPGKKIFVEVQITDGMNWTDWFRSQTVQVMTPEGAILDVRIEPSAPFNDSILQAVVDCLGCENMMLHYQWVINDIPLENYDAPELDGRFAQLKPNDQVLVKVYSENNPAEIHSSPPVKIANRAPIFPDRGKVWIEAGVLYFQFQARDPDGEPLTYQLVNAPPGANLNPRTETVSWAIPEGFEGPVQIEVKVSDPSGAESSTRVSLKIEGGEVF